MTQTKKPPANPGRFSVAEMIAPGVGIRVMIATSPIDFRKDMDGLAALVKEHLGAACKLWLR